MRVQDLQQFLSNFTAANKDGSRQGNAISNAVIKTSPISMYHGHRIRELAACGLKLDACYSGWDACRLALEA
jgi:hypothetical protein